MRAIRGIDNSPTGFDVHVVAPDGLATGADPVSVSAYDEKGRLLAETAALFAEGSAETVARFDVPFELRNDFATIRMTGQQHAGGVWLVDENTRRRRVGLLTGQAGDLDQPLLSPLFYIQRALAPFADLVEGQTGDLAVDVPALIEQGQVAKMICSFPRSADPKVFTDLYLAGKIVLELVPQGTLAERIRAGGAGIPAFYTPTSYGTDLAEGKPVAEFEGRAYVQERWLKADFALIKAELGDPLGNLTYRMAARNFNPLMAMAATRTVAQVTRIVPTGEIDPEQVVTPGIFVDGLVEVPDPKQEEILNREGAVYP